MPYLPYEEPGIVVILSLTGFLIVLNGVRYGLDRLLYCGLVGEILLGTIWGLPVGGTAWLSRNTQEAIQAFGYLGLVGLVFEGGLSTSPIQLRKAMLLSISVATVGLLLPIALSFLLLLLPLESTTGTAYPTTLAAFSAGASLCSTSLGTTFAVLSSAKMQSTRTGVVLVGAAMMDDVVGLVMVNIVNTLGKGASGAWPIARPIVASFGLLLVSLLVTSFVIRPAWKIISSFSLDIDIGNVPDGAATTKRWLQSQLLTLIRRTPHLPFVFATLTLLMFITIASSIDASVLLAAFIAGGTVTYLWNSGADEGTANGASVMFDQYYRPLLEFIFIPFFFASIGFSIPITSMFRGPIIWKGTVYAILMAIAKAAVSIVVYAEYFIQKWKHRWSSRPTRGPQSSETAQGAPHIQTWITAFAMVARGEVGFLIASLSQSSNTLTLQRDGLPVESLHSEDIFLIVVWAVVLCTIVGPVLVGVIVRRQLRSV